jgi:predicted AlkP superfamily phosphohydrolase/phosphomutase
MARQVLVIGLDGGTWAVFDRFMALGLMPNLQRLCATGYRAKLMSVVPSLTPSAWTSFATGVNPGKHGVFGWTLPQQAPGEYWAPPVRCDAITEPTLWRRLSDAGLRCSVVCVPLTYPPQPVNGALVTGMLTPGPDADRTWPPDLKQELAAHGCLPRFEIDVTPSPAGGWELPQIDDVTRLTEEVFRTTQYLIARPWDFFMVVFVGTDRLQHTQWDSIMAAASGAETPAARRLRDFYTMIDERLGRVIDLAGPDATCILMSDHGLGRCAGRFSFCRWLINRGYASYRPKRLRQVAKKVLNASGLRRLVERTLSAETFAQVSTGTVPLDWGRTRVFPYHGGLGFRINLKGREKQGMIEPGAEFEALREELRRELLALTVPPDERPIVSQVYYAEEFYQGPYVAFAPDVIAVADPEVGYEFDFGNPGVPDLVMHDLVFNGNHRADGILLACGPGVRSVRDAPPARIIDLTPTILWLLGRPVPENMDGRVLREAFANDTEVLTEPTVAGGSAQPPLPPPAQYSPEERQVIEERLRKLGYL